MWFEILLIACAGICFINVEKKYCTEDNETKLHTAVCFLAPVFFLLLYQRLFSIKELLIAYFLVLAFCGIEFIARIAGKIPKLLPFFTKIGMMMLLYLLVLNHYQPDDDGTGMSREEVMVIFACISLLFIFSNLLRAWVIKKSWNLFYGIFIAPVLGFFIIEQAFNDNLNKMEWQYISGNILCLAVLMIIPCCLFRAHRMVMSTGLTICLIFGLANYYVGLFRGSPVMPNDLMSVGTAVQVAGGYGFVISEQVIASVLYWYAGITVLCILPEIKADHRWKIKAVILSLVLCICIHSVCSIDIEEKYNWHIDQGALISSYWEAGSIFSFITLLKKMSVEVPDHYSEQKAEELFAQNQPVQADVLPEPSILVIMDESFSDLRTLGDFECSEEYLENWYAVDDFVCRGKMYSSVYGGWTANSEFEFLTGCSMANCPTGAVSYHSYSLKNVGNMADILKNQGYQTVAIHPQNKGNWNRTRVYKNFGFQDFLGIDDFEDPVYIRSNVSDQSSFEKMIEIYEENDREKQFIFHVTMQNHGGYDLKELEGLDIVTLTGETKEYQDVETYLTLIRESDKAIYHLIEYFRNVEEPVIICIFGDHLPGLDQIWMEEVMGKKADSLNLEELESKYAVPYMIWANYDTPYQKQEMDTSANYLGALLLENTGVTQTAYTNFLLNMRSQIPVLNLFGYQTNDGKWHSFEDQTDVSEWLEHYRILQYNAMFDSKRNMKNYR